MLPRKEIFKIKLHVQRTVSQKSILRGIKKCNILLSLLSTLSQIKYNPLKLIWYLVNSFPFIDFLASSLGKICQGNSCNGSTSLDPIPKEAKEKKKRPLTSNKGRWGLNYICGVKTYMSPFGKTLAQLAFSSVSKFPFFNSPKTELSNQ